MRIVEAYPHEGHPYWQKGEWSLKWRNGDEIELPGTHIGGLTDDSYIIEFKDDGIYYTPCACGSGFGKIRIKDRTQKILSITEYDALVIMNHEPQQSENLKNDLNSIEL